MLQDFSGRKDTVPIGTRTSPGERYRSDKYQDIAGKESRQLG
jgi:hypothetical protein